MAELDFNGLRADVEAATMLPGFDEVARRARRARFRSRFASLIAVLAVLALLVPAGLIAARERPGGEGRLGPVSGPDLPTPLQIGLQTPEPSPTPTVAPQVTIVAADGADIGHLYALADVCVAGSCNLQLSQIRSGQKLTGGGPDRIGLLRDRPTDFLTGYRVEALSETSLVVSAVTSDGSRKYQRISVGNISDESSSSTAQVGDRVAVVDSTGQLWAMDAKSGQLRVVPHQPPLRNLEVASTAARDGLWVTGTNPITGNVAVSVSRDAGRTWTTVGLDVAAGLNTPVLATYQGQTAYLLTRTVDRTVALFRTTDGGRSWHQLTTVLPWPAQSDPGVGYGLIVRPDGSLLAWLATSPALVYTQSTNGGTSFTNVAGPGGPVIAVSDGYASLGVAPRLSSDGSSWIPATLPVLQVTR